MTSRGLWVLVVSTGLLLCVVASALFDTHPDEARVDSEATFLSSESSSVRERSPIVDASVVGRVEVVERQPEADGAFVRVVFDHDGSPAPGAMVYLGSIPWGLRYGKELPIDPTVGALSYLADEQGYARVPKTMPGATVPYSGLDYLYARHGGAEGGGPRIGSWSDELTPDGQIPEVRIAPEDRFVIRVNDPGGSLARAGGARLSLVSAGERRTGRFISNSSGVCRIRLGMPDEAGCLTIRHSRWLRAFCRVGEAASDYVELTLEDRVVFRRPISLARSRTVSFDVPTLVDLRVRFAHPDGEPFTGRSVLKIREVVDGGRPWQIVDESKHGEVFLPAVAVGQRLELVAAPLDRSFMPSIPKRITVDEGSDEVFESTVYFHRPGEPIAVPRDSAARMVGWVVDEQGRPVRDATMTLNRGAFSETYRLTCSTDADGRMEWPVSKSTFELVSISVGFSIPTADSGERHVDFRFEGQVLPGINDLGTQVARLPTVICGGTVLDTEGKPISGASVQLGVVRQLDSIWTSHDQGLHRVLTDVDGRFRLRGFGTRREGQAWITAIAPPPPGFETAKDDLQMHRIELGDRDVAITLTTKRGLHGVLSLPDGVRGDQFLVRVGGGPRGSLVLVESSGRFAASVPVNDTSIRVYLNGKTTPILTVPGVSVDSTVARDGPAKVVEFDLESLSVARIRVLDSSGDPAAGCPIKVGRFFGKTYETDDRGEFALGMSDPEKTITVGGADDAPSVSVTVSAGETIVRLP